jgi:hypothetical protein
MAQYPTQGHTSGMKTHPAKAVRVWWALPARPGMQRLIIPWEYRHLRGFGIVRVVGGCLAAAAGLVCLGYDAYAWAAFFLAVAALDLAVGWWYLAIVRSPSGRN